MKRVWLLWCDDGVLVSAHSTEEGAENARRETIENLARESDTHSEDWEWEDDYYIMEQPVD